MGRGTALDFLRVSHVRQVFDPNVINGCRICALVIAPPRSSRAQRKAEPRGAVTTLNKSKKGDTRGKTVTSRLLFRRVPRRSAH